MTVLKSLLRAFRRTEVSALQDLVDELDAAYTGGGSGVDIEDEGTPVATATTLNFTGAGVDATDAGGGTVDVDIPGGGSGTFVAKVRQTLTDKTSFSGTGNEQWGTEEATFDDASLPSTSNVTVDAELVGFGTDWSNSNSIIFFVEISLDGGSTWDTGLATAIRANPAQNATARHIIVARHSVTGTVTGDIQARAMAQQGVGAAFPTDLNNGVIYMDVMV